MAKKKTRRRKRPPAKSMTLSPLVLEHLIRAAIVSREIRDQDRPALVQALNDLKD